MYGVSCVEERGTFSTYITYIAGASSTPGPNAPLGNRCGTSTRPQYSAKAAFGQWTSAGFPANKLLLGLPLYGYVSESTATVLTGSSVPSFGDELKLPNSLAESQDGSSTITETKKVNAQGSGDLSSFFGAAIAFNNIVSYGALQKTSAGTYVQANGYTYGKSPISNLCTLRRRY